MFAAPKYQNRPSIEVSGHEHHTACEQVDLDLATNAAPDMTSGQIKVWLDQQEAGYTQVARKAMSHSFARVILVGSGTLETAVFGR